MQVFLHHGDLPDNHTLNSAHTIAIDTETMGLEVHRDRLCLVQLSAGDGVCHLVKVDKNQVPPQNLVALLVNPKITKIFHFARFDIATLYKHFGVLTAPIFCTKIASKLVRTFTDRHGLKDLCKEIIKVDISKQEQTSDWGAATLTDDQQKYAATDVLYLHQLMDHFDKILTREERMGIAKAAFAFLPIRAQLDVMAGSNYDILSY
ncbi:MAG: ribonuclease D [Alphaproteobacteria bacterium]|nr:ribonuclease D [Alphaproteobacteria bacterium]